MDEIIEALENSAVSRKAGQGLHSGCPDKRDVTNWRDRLMRFLGDLDGNLTVDEIRLALEDYE